MPPPRESAQDRLTRAAAASLGAPDALAPVLADLFANVHSLGAFPHVVVNMLRRAGIEQSSRVLDLGCGKGAVALLTARRLGCRVLGIDGYAPFIRAAREAAKRKALSPRCTFRVGDARESDWARRASTFDAALMLNLYPCGSAARILRRWVSPGGVFVLDDAFRTGRPPANTRAVPTLNQCRASIEGFGDAIEEEVVIPADDLQAATEAAVRKLAETARRMSRRHPQLKPSLDEYLATLLRSGRLLRSSIHPAVWLVRRAAL